MRYINTITITITIKTDGCRRCVSILLLSSFLGDDKLSHDKGVRWEGGREGTVGKQVNERETTCTWKVLWGFITSVFSKVLKSS